MREPYDPRYLTEIIEAELAAIVAHHTEMARLERECAKLIERRRQHEDEDGDWNADDA